jgi:hypothetical protein
MKKKGCGKIAICSTKLDDPYLVGNQQTQTPKPNSHQFPDLL